MLEFIATAFVFLGLTGAYVNACGKILFPLRGKGGKPSPLGEYFSIMRHGI